MRRSKAAYTNRSKRRNKTIPCFASGRAVGVKSGIHFGFAFNIPDPTTRVDIPWGVMQLEKDQLPGANATGLLFSAGLIFQTTKEALPGVLWMHRFLKAGI